MCVSCHIFTLLIYVSSKFHMDVIVKQNFKQLDQQRLIPMKGKLLSVVELVLL